MLQSIYLSRPTIIYIFFKRFKKVQWSFLYIFNNRDIRAWTINWITWLPCTRLVRQKKKMSSIVTMNVQWILKKKSTVFPTSPFPQPCVNREEKSPSPAPHTTWCPSRARLCRTYFQRCNTAWTTAPTGRGKTRGDRLGPELNGFAGINRRSCIFREKNTQWSAYIIRNQLDGGAWYQCEKIRPRVIVVSDHLLLPGYTRSWRSYTHGGLCYRTVPLGM